MRPANSALYALSKNTASVSGPIVLGAASSLTRLVRRMPPVLSAISA
jgi:hypothetical protein